MHLLQICISRADLQSHPASFSARREGWQACRKTLTISGDRMMNRSINSRAAQMEAFWIVPFSDSMKRLPLTTI